MYMYDISLSHVVPHKHWNEKKDCPSRLLSGMYGGWDGFIAQVEKFYTDHDIFRIWDIAWDIT